MNGNEIYNRECTCERCGRKRMMGGAVLLTLGGLFLLKEFTHIGFQWPVLLIVIGLVMVWQHSASTEGHIPRGCLPPPPPASPQSPPPPPAPNSESQVPHV